VGGVPHDAAIFNQQRLRRLVPDSETLRYGIGQPAILDDENDAAGQIAIAFQEIDKLCVHLHADRTLRAMLKNENGIGFRTLEKFFEILILA
jgi:hypothetical protein